MKFYYLLDRTTSETEGRCLFWGNYVWTCTQPRQQS